MEGENHTGLYLVGIIVLLILIPAAAFGAILPIGLLATFSAECKILGLCHGVGEGGTSGITGPAVDCGGANVPEEYMPWVKEAADKYLGGDQAKLIAVIQFESGFNRWAISYGGAVGLGQFIASSARTKQAFQGSSIYDVEPRTGPIIPGTNVRSVTKEDAEIFRKTHPDDGRFDPERSLKAAAELLYYGLQRAGGDFRRAYAESYNGEAGNKKYENADKMMVIYNQLIQSGKCK